MMSAPRLIASLFALFVFTIGSAGPALGQGAEDDTEDPVVVALDRKIDALFKNLVEPTVTAENALTEFVAGSPLAEQPEAVKTLAARTKDFDKKYGAFVATERIVTRRIGKDLVLLRYLYKAEKHPVVWYFTYYRDFKNPDTTAEAGNWIVIAVRFDTRLDLLGL